jgi:hypothetical protein
MWNAAGRGSLGHLRPQRNSSPPRRHSTTRFANDNRTWYAPRPIVWRERITSDNMTDDRL